MVMWKVELTDSWQNSSMDFSQHHPDAMAMLMRNLAHFIAQLRASKSSKTIEALYLHRFAAGVIGIDQTGIEEGLLDSYIYAIPDDSARILRVILVGKATERDSDIEYCRQFAFYLAEGQP